MHCSILHVTTVHWSLTSFSQGIAVGGDVIHVHLDTLFNKFNTFPEFETLEKG